MPLFLQAFLETATNEQKQGLHDWLLSTSDTLVFIELWEALDTTTEDPAIAACRVFTGVGEWEEEGE